MFIRELKINLKSMLIWNLVLSFFFVIVFIIYPIIFTEESIESLKEVLKAFPEELIKSMNINVDDILTPSGWITSEGILIMLLSSAIFSSILGIKVITNEIQTGTIEYLMARPMSRVSLLLKKISSNLILIIAFNLINLIVITCGLAISKDLNFTKILCICISPIFVSIFMYFLSLIISLVIKGNVMIGIGASFAFYMLTVISDLSDKVSFLKYFTPFTASNTAYILAHNNLNYIAIIVTMILSGALFAGSVYLFRKKELV